MDKIRYIFRQDADKWLGYFEEYPDYVTQGEDIEDLKDQLLDLYRDLTSGQIPSIRRAAELEVS